ncbi:uncharacterized protein CBL_20949 [Carabus blaptoides fortunei]
MVISHNFGNIIFGDCVLIAAISSRILLEVKLHQQNIYSSIIEILTVSPNKHCSFIYKYISPSTWKVKIDRAAVCSDAVPCSNIGRMALEQRGSAVDAAIATLFCNGIVNMQSMGLGGGFLMTIYTKNDRKAVTLNARETAPLNATWDMYQNEDQSRKGALAVGVPGELRGYWAAHQRFGKLPWRSLVEPSIKLCENGYNMSKAQHDALKTNSYVKDDETLNELFTDEMGDFKRRGSWIKPKQYCKTLRLIADLGGDVLYNGTLADSFVEDIQEMGGIIMKEDMENYQPIWDDPISTKLNDDILYSVPPPGSGVLLGFILNILKGYNFTSDHIIGINNTVYTYHKIIESFKYAYAKRTELGDPAFNNITALISNLTSTQYADYVREKIKENYTYNDPKHYGAVFYNKGNHGTAHISVISPDGDAVSVTSTVNLYFGAGITSRQTGIILNSGMDDFSSRFPNYFGLPGSPANFIAPGKRPLSSMSPTILVDKDGEVRLVIGASGGTKITTAMALVIMRALWFGQDIKQAVDAPRIHHQVHPMEISYEYGILQQIIEGLEALGHKTSRYRDRGSIICALFRNKSQIWSNADYRKGGDASGY